MLTPREHAEMISQLEATLAHLKKCPPKQCCLNCDNYDKGHCLHWKANVPTENQEDGCDEWIESLPF